MCSIWYLFVTPTASVCHTLAYRAMIGTPGVPCMCVCVCVHAWVVRRRSYEWAERGVLSDTIAAVRWGVPSTLHVCTERRKKREKKVSVWISPGHLTNLILWGLIAAALVLSVDVSACLPACPFSLSLPSFILSSCLSLFLCLTERLEINLFILIHGKALICVFFSVFVIRLAFSNHQDG